MRITKLLFLLLLIGFSVQQNSDHHQDHLELSYGHVEDSSIASANMATIIEYNETHALVRTLENKDTCIIYTPLAYKLTWKIRTS